MFLKIQKNIQLVLFIFLLLPVAQSHAEGEIKIPAPPRLAASSYFLQDFDSGRILAERNADEVLPKILRFFWVILLKVNSLTESQR
jgi:D-alanyl-D-alanine carboxypeptidase (penicillin-binding protein 5/6)